MTVRDRLFRTTNQVFTLVRCAGCGLMRLDPQPARDELARFYPQEYWHDPESAGAADRIGEAYRRLVIRDHLRFVERGLSGRVLDVGCGNGLFLHMLRDRAGGRVQVAGVDVSRSALKAAVLSYGLPAACAELSQPPFRAAQFDTITMFHVLEHLPDPRVYLRRAHDLLRPKGRLIVQVPNAACGQFRLLGRRWHGLEIPRHLWHFRGRDIERLLTQCGFRVARRKNWSLRDNPAALALGLAPGLDPLARRYLRKTESGLGALVRNALHFGLIVAAIPFTALESAFGGGSTVMLEAFRE